jgi:hypothetical protein
MLSLWFRSFSWAAWWPVSTWLLTVQKSQRQRTAGQTQARIGAPRPGDGQREIPMTDDAPHGMPGGTP